MRARLLPKPWVDAIREDAASVSGSNLARRRLEIQERIVWPHRVTVRVGERPRRDVAHMDSGDFSRYIGLSVYWAKRPPTCRACGEKIGHGKRAVVFGLEPSRRCSDGRRAFVHVDCPSAP